MSSPVRYPNGVSTDRAGPLNQYGAPDPTKWHTYFNDFDHYVAADWTVTETQSGATETLADADGGVLLLTNTTADNDLIGMNKVGESFKFVAGKRAVFKARFKISDATDSDFVIGLQITDTTPLAVSDGVYFQKDDDDAYLDFHVTKNSTSTDATAIATLVSDTWVTVGFYYDGKSSIEYYVNGVKTGTAATTNLVDDEELTVSIALQNGAAASKTASIDYVFAAFER